MKNYRRTNIINRFSALTTSFKGEFTPLYQRKRNLSLVLSTVIQPRSNENEANWLESLLEIWHQGAMVFDSRGRVGQATEFTEKMLAKYFPDEETESNGLPVKLAEWMEDHKFSGSGDGVSMTYEPFVIENDDGELRIRLIVDNRKRRKTLLLRETVQIQPESLMALGLTKRESEVLFLIAKGKTNSEIGILLGISKRTVQKHVEHIYIKLGVETRTAAMLRVNELNPNFTSEGFLFDDEEIIFDHETPEV